MNITYDKIGTRYSVTRQPDPRIAKRIDEALENSESVINVGAGSGHHLFCEITI